MTRCARCGADIPEGGQFCIECGAPAPAQVATGPTERLREYAGGAICANCGTRNPNGAEFCVICGRNLAARPFAEPPAATPPAPALPQPLASVPAQPAAAPNPPSRPRASVQWDGLTGGIWLIGLALLFITGWWWPGILVLVGLSSLFSGLAHARDANARRGALQGAAWMLGLAVLAVFDWWWPGILILVGLSAILGAVSFHKA